MHIETDPLFLLHLILNIIWMYWSRYWISNLLLFWQEVNYAESVTVSVCMNLFFSDAAWNIKNQKYIAVTNFLWHVFNTWYLVKVAKMFPQKPKSHQKRTKSLKLDLNLIWGKILHQCDVHSSAIYTVVLYHPPNSY